MAEDFGARADSPQTACLQELRNSNVVVLILGERYGWVAQGSDVSPTHEEFLEAQNTKQILVFVKANAEFENRQKAFVEEVGKWQSGSFYSPFADSADLKAKVTRALHEQTVANAVGRLCHVNGHLLGSLTATVVT